MITVIGIDPGLASTGIGIVRGAARGIGSWAYGGITTPKCDTMAQRLHQIYSKLSMLLTEQRPDLIIVEDVFSLAKYPKSGITLGKVTGAILLAGVQLGIPLVEVAVREAKQVLTGNGNAAKAQLEKAVRHALNLSEPIKPDHASDALGLALIGLYRYENYICGKADCQS